MNIFSEKYRPHILEQIKSQNNILIVLNNLIKNNIQNNILFYGLPGCGKTSCALSFAKTYYGDDYKNMILEVNASENRGINIVRDEITDFINTKLFFTEKKKIIILDEADSMTIDAQNLLIKLMESHKDNAIFIIICNYINKITIAIKSRCLSFRFNKIKYTDMYNILKNIQEKEQIIINDEKIYKDIYKFGNGDMRKCINIFQNLTFDNELKDTNIYKLFNYPTENDIMKIINILLNDDNIINNYTEINHIIKENNLILKTIINELIITINKKAIIQNKKKYLYILEEIGNIEYNITNDFNYKIQVYSLISIFKK